MNQSSPRWLSRRGVAVAGRRGTAAARSASPLARSPRRALVGRSGRAIGTGARTGRSPPSSVIESSGCRLPAAPSTTIGVPSLYSGAAFTCSRVSSSVMLSRLLATLSEMQRVPVDHDLAAADAEKAAEIDDGGAHLPARSTITSTMRPMFSSAVLRTSRPSMPCASLAPITVTEGGGAGSFDGILWQRRALPCVAPVSLCGRNRKRRSSVKRRRSGAAIENNGAHVASCNFQDAWSRGLQFLMRQIRSTPEFGRAFAAPRATLPRRGGEPEDQRSKARAAGRAAPPR